MRLRPEIRISTGVFGYPQVDAARTAVEAVRTWLDTSGGASTLGKIVFNTFTDRDTAIYRELLEVG